MLKATMSSSLIAASLVFAAGAHADKGKRKAYAPSRALDQRVVVKAGAKRQGHRVVVKARAKRWGHQAVTRVARDTRGRHGVVAAVPAVHRRARLRPSRRTAVANYRAPTAAVSYRAATPGVVHYRYAAPSRQPVVVRTLQRRKFRRLDRNRDGYISRLEARRAGYSRRAFRFADDDRDGFLTRRETRSL